jgi:cellulose synthase/poly-beta-1,6-N-acetylglucosamine synthase-like glycosyltransferase
VTILLIIFWFSLAVILFTYVLFPAAIILRGRFFPRPYRKDRIHPNISLVLAVHNEEDDLPAKLENILRMQYPTDKFEAVIASDGSTDRTNEILEQGQSSKIKLLLLPRAGKAHALNAAVEHSHGEILVFSDANSIYAPDALQKLVEPFADPAVGGVAGNQRYLSERVPT